MLRVLGLGIGPTLRTYCAVSDGQVSLLGVQAVVSNMPA